jgi:hypothetical protein
MARAHYTQAKASNQKFEPVYPNLFEVTILSPTVPDSSLVLEHVKSIGGLQNINPNVDAITQKYKWTDRSYAGMPSQTYVDLTLVFTLNLNFANEMYMYKQMKAWYDLAYNPANGTMGLKRDYVGSLVVVQYNRVTDIFRKMVFKDAFPIGQPQLLDELNYETTDAQDITITIRSDVWEEVNV